MRSTAYLLTEKTPLLIGYLFFMTFYLLGCDNKPERNGSTKKIDSIKPIPGKNDSIPAEVAEKGEVLIAYSDCYTCHKEDEKSVGPAFKDIAKRYPVNKVYIEMLAQKVIVGGSGSWGSPIMDSHPIILVGQSIGGLIVRLYTEHYGKNVAGLILVDPTHESSVLGSMKYGGWVRLREKAIGKPIPKPQVKDSISAGYDSTADYMAEEFQNLYLASIKNPQQLGSRPVIILGAGIRKQPPGTPDEQWKRLRDERDTQIQGLTVLSTNSKFILDPKSSHLIQNDNPEIVARAIQMVIDSIASKTKL